MSALRLLRLCLALLPLLVTRPTRTEQASQRQDGQDGLGPRLLCVVKGARFSPGESWIHDEECAHCSCTEHGISLCRPISCQYQHKPPADCHAVTRASARNATCCPVCSDCTSKSGDSSVWEEDECTTCRCVDGRKRCHSTACRLNCVQPVRLVGHCCPTCPDAADNRPQHSANDEGVSSVLAALIVASLACVAFGAACLWKKSRRMLVSSDDAGATNDSDTKFELSSP